MRDNEDVWVKRKEILSRTGLFPTFLPVFFHERSPRGPNLRFVLYPSTSFLKFTETEFRNIGNPGFYIMMKLGDWKMLSPEMNAIFDICEWPRSFCLFYLRLFNRYWSRK